MNQRTGKFQPSRLQLVLLFLLFVAFVVLMVYVTTNGELFTVDINEIQSYARRRDGHWWLYS